MAKLSELKPGQKVAFSPIHDKSQKMTGEIVDYVFLAVIQTADGKSYAHSDDIDVLEQPKPKLSDEIRQSIADQIKASIAEVQAAQGTSAPAPAPPEWDEGTPDSTTAVDEKSGSTEEKTT